VAKMAGGARGGGDRHNLNVIFRFACRTCQTERRLQCADEPHADSVSTYPSIDHDTAYPHRISCLRPFIHSFIHSLCRSVINLSTVAWTGGIRSTLTLWNQARQRLPPR